MMLGSKLGQILKTTICIYKGFYIVCMKHLNDPVNANAAIERAAIMPDALKNPLIYLNGAIHCYDIGNYERSQLMLTNLINIADHVGLRNDVNLI